MTEPIRGRIVPMPVRVGEALIVRKGQKWEGMTAGMDLAIWTTEDGKRLVEALKPVNGDGPMLDGGDE